MVVWLASYPRSGNTFVRVLLSEVYGQPSWSLYPDDPASVGDCIAPGSGSFAKSLQEMRKSPRIHFVKTHEPPEDDSPAVLIVRDGRDAIVSYAHFIQDFGLVTRKGLERFAANCIEFGSELIRGRSRFEQLLRRVIVGEYHDWSEHYFAWTRRAAPCARLSFETLIRNPESSLQSALDELGLQLPCRAVDGGSVPSFSKLHEKDPKFFRSGKVGQWRSEMDGEVEGLFWERHAQAMVQAGYARAAAGGVAAIGQ